MRRSQRLSALVWGSSHRRFVAIGTVILTSFHIQAQHRLSSPPPALKRDRTASRTSVSAVPREVRDCAELARDFPLSPQAASRNDDLRAQWKQIQTDYAETSKTLRRKLDPRLIKDHIARRFINPPDWHAYKSRSPSVIRPEEVYEPKPSTWLNWQRTTLGPVAELARSQKPIQLSDLLKWNEDALIGTLSPHTKIGQLKNVRNIGRNIKKREALDASEIEALASLGLEYTPLKCEEDLPENIKPDLSIAECKSTKTLTHIWKFEPYKSVASDFSGKTFPREELAKKFYWYACWPRARAPERAGERVCGMFDYPDVRHAGPGMKTLLQEVEAFEKCAKEPTKIDSFAYLLDLQRRVVALHPFNKGNGRNSRWLMDVLAERLGYPPLLVADMNKDLSTPFDKHLKGVEEETRKGLDILKNCLERHKSDNIRGVQASACGILGGDT